MRLRILTWNIKNFSTSDLETPAYYNYIRHVIGPSGPAEEADLFIVLEVTSSGGEVGTPIRTHSGNKTSERGGAAAVCRLVDNLRAESNVSNDWCLVPPLRLSQTSSEGIAVFYRSDKLTFTGPRQNYQQYGGSCFESLGDLAPAVGSKLAGQCNFQNAYGQEIGFPYQRNRRPWLTTFKTTGPNSTPFKLLAVHAPPVAQGRKRKRSVDGYECFQAVQKLSEIQEICGGGTKSILVGDFNCNYTNSDFREAYNKIEGLGFRAQNKNEETTLKIPKTKKSKNRPKMGNYKTENVFDNVFVKGIDIASGGHGRPSSAVIDLVKGHPEGYPPIKALTPSNPSNFEQMKNNPISFNANMKAIPSDHLPVYADIEL